jgi:phosphoheptose isomerase
MHVDRVSQTLKALDKSRLQDLSFLIAKKVFEEGSALFICGNGGSFAIATHFATDLHKIGIDFEVASRIVSLGTNSSLTSAISNDYGFNFIFAKELSNLAKPGDIIFVISSSGTSPNILENLQIAKNKGLISIALTGFKNDKIKNEWDASINLELEQGEYELAEDVHSIICHSIAILIREFTRNLRK